uniref:Uncharacterized protein n=1 Tax=Anguilla anguilla TaxID=7936 RepID=A0A0E9U7U3_ANGAN
MFSAFYLPVTHQVLNCLTAMLKHGFSSVKELWLQMLRFQTAIHKPLSLLVNRF